jgi:hypothetical protein
LTIKHIDPREGENIFALFAAWRAIQRGRVKSWHGDARTLTVVRTLRGKQVVQVFNLARA